MIVQPVILNIAAGVGVTSTTTVRVQDRSRNVLYSVLYNTNKDYNFQIKVQGEDRIIIEMPAQSSTFGETILNEVVEAVGSNYPAVYSILLTNNTAVAIVNAYVGLKLGQRTAEGLVK